jgi:iron complex outermembrane recepter protein
VAVVAEGEAVTAAERRRCRSSLGRRSSVLVLLTLTAASLPLRVVAADEPPIYQVAPIEVVGVTPVLGTGIDKDRVPVNVQSFSAGEISTGSPLGIHDALSRRLGSIADYQGNELQPSLSLRGFTASPVLGEPQGLAVYQNGMRVNEAFGDVVNWDLIPSFAVHKLQMLPGSNPVFGLNALGGALSMQMKNGFDDKGGSADVAGGLNGRAKAIAEIGGQSGNFGFYSGALALTDDGWRQHSPSRMVQSYTDLGWRGPSTELGVGITLAGSTLGNNGSTPREILNASWSTPFTTPDNQRDSVAAVDLRLAQEIDDSTSLQATAYFRHLRSAVENGNTSQFQDCGDASAGLLCNDSGLPLVDRRGSPVSTPPAPIAQINDLLTQSDGAGASAQVTRQGRLFGMSNTAVLGLSLDAGRTGYTATTLLGSFNDQRIAVPNGYALGGIDFTRVRADNNYGGLYATDTLSLTPVLDLSLAGRYNAAEVKLRDENGTALNGDHSFFRFNPSAGLAWKLAPDLTAFANYSEANRIPTPAELSCADPNQPCRVPNAFAGDPALKQVVSHSVEAGARGRIKSGGQTSANWSAAGFLSNNQNDIIFVTSPAQTTAGFFQNAGYTQRIGLESRIDGRWGAFGWFAGYTLVRATFESSLAINNPANPGADADGNIHVRPGDVMPGVSLHTLKLGGDYAVTSRWTVGGDMTASSGVYLRGDEANRQKKTAPYAVFNAETAYRLAGYATAYVRANNLFNAKYATAGVYSDGSELGYPATDRFLTPGAPFNLWAGMRMTF